MILTLKAKCVVLKYPYFMRLPDKRMKPTFFEKLDKICKKV